MTDAPTEPSKEALEAARIAIRRGAMLGAAIPPCRCFSIAAPRQTPRCNGVCEEAAEHVALALDRFRAAGVREERERCVKVCQERSAWAEALIKNENDDMWANYSNACDDCAELVGETP